MEHTENLNLLLARYLSGERLSEAQQAEVECWIAKNSHEYQRLSNLFTPSSSTPIELDVDKAWKRVESRLKEKNWLAKNFYKISAIAASLLFLIGLYFSLNNTNQSESFFLANTSTINRAVILPDSSSVLLYPLSTIQYSAYPTKGDRVVHLKGKAFFQVKKQDGRPFIINVKPLLVKVLGTSFLIDGLDKGNMGVFVKTGKVEVTTKKHTILLKRNEQLEVVGNLFRKSDITNPLLFFDGNSHPLLFENISVKDVIEQLERVFNVKIAYDEKIGINRITTKFNGESLDAILLELTYLCRCKSKLISPKKYKLYYDR